MKFDDYNYNAFNQYVLVKDPGDHSKRLDELEERLSEAQKQKAGTDPNTPAGEIAEPVSASVKQKKQLSLHELQEIDRDKPFKHEALYVEAGEFEKRVSEGLSGIFKASKASRETQ